jgi:RHS repeat-associated protein
VATVNALGRRTSTIYRATGDVAATVDALGNRTSSLYDAASRQIASVNALGQRSTTTLDAAGQSIARIDPLGRRTSTAYDAAGRAIQSLDANGNRTSTLYDAAGRALAGVNGLGYRTSNTFDAAGRRVVLTDARGYRTSFLFDAKSQDLGSIDPLGRRVSFGYDGVGNKTFKLDPRGNRVSFSYDAAQRLILEKYSTGMRVSSSYDAVGNRTVLADAIGRTSSAFDAKNRQVQSVNPDGKRVSYTLDALDRRSRLIDPNGGRFSYSYDARDQLTAMTNPQSKRTSFTLDALGRQTVQRHANGARTSQTFDAAGQLIVLANTQGNGATVNRFSYTFDQVGNRVGVKESSGDRTSWTFDKAYQLVREFRTGATAFNVTYAYDPAGNRSVQTDSGTRTSYTLDAANQLTLENTSGARTSYTNDSCGNRTLKNAPGGMVFYAWDEKNRLKQVDPVGGPVTMLYNGDNKRVQKKTSGQTRKFLYDLDKVLEEYDATGAVSKEYTSTTEQYGELLSAFSGGNTSYYEPDALGSTDALLNDAGTVSDRYAYRAFGLALALQGSTANDYQFVGRQGYFKDPEISFYFLNNRYLDFATGRFVSEDPSGYKGGDANLYRYVGNNPVNGIDPSGLSLVVSRNDTYSYFYRIGIDPETPESVFASLNQTQRFQAREWGYYWSTNKVLRSRNLDLFRDYIFPNYGRWQGYWDRIQERDIYSNGVVEVTADGVDYLQVELFKTLPAVFWKNLQSAPRSEVTDHIKGSLNNNNYIITRGDVSFDFGGFRNSSSVWNQLWQWLQQATNAVIRLGRLALQSVQEYLQLAFVSFLRAAGIDPDQFQGAIQLFRESTTIIWQIAQDPIGYAKNLANGGLEGLTEFAAGFPGNIKAIALDWLLGSLDSLRSIWNTVKNDLPTEFTLESMGLFLLKAAGLNYESLPAILASLGITDPGPALSTIETLLGDPLSFQNIQDEVAAYNRDGPSDGPFNLNDIWTQALGSVKGKLYQWGLVKFAEFSAKFLFPATGALAAIWKTLQWVWDNRNQLGNFFATIGQVLRAAYSNPQSVASKVVAGLTALTKLLLDLIARQVGATRLISSINQLVQRVLTWLPNKIRQLICWLLAQFGFRPRGCIRQRGGDSACRTRPGGMGPRRMRRMGPGTCFAADTLVLTADGLRHIGEIEVGWLLPPLKPWQRTSAETGPLLERDEAKLRVVRCRLDKAPGQWVDITLLRPVEWIEARQVRAGGRLAFAMPEMGVVGDAVVNAVETCLPLPRGEGGVVTATFRHSEGELLELAVEGEGQPIKVTASHPFWSPGRRDWVAAGDLEIGERLQAENGSTPSLIRRSERELEPVYNIEVDGDHCYRVGKQGLLVHNASAVTICCNPPGGFVRSTGTTNVTVPWFNRPIARPNGAVALVTPTSTGTDPTREFDRAGNLPPWWSALTTAFPQAMFSPGEWQRGHLIGNQLHGPGGQTWWNMVPLHRQANSPVMSRCEDQIRAAAERGECIDVKVTPTYGNRMVVPTFVRIVAVSQNSTFRIDVNIPNTSTSTHQC